MDIVVNNPVELNDQQTSTNFKDMKILQTSSVSFLVLKVASRCNLNCSYCYMYNLGDKSYLKQPKVMSDIVVDSVINLAALHVKQYKLSSFGFGFHGGEPILAGRKFFKDFVDKATKKFAALGFIPSFYMQTNGVLMTRKFAKLFKDLNISIGISLDGTKESNDKYRLDHKGKSTYDRVIAGIKNMKDDESGKINAGILNVINIDSDPIELYYHYKEQLNTLSFDLFATTRKS